MSQKTVDFYKTLESKLKLTRNKKNEAQPFTGLILAQRSFIWYVREILQKTIISYPLISTRTSAYQGVRNVSFSENISYLLNG